ncbi:MAG: hypothetical protein ACJ764_15630 [Solirubrobacteraceae bacterium]
MTQAAVTVLVMERTRVEPELEELLGAERSAVLQAEMNAQATAWARELASEDAHTASEDASLSGEVSRLLSQASGPLLVVWPSLPLLRREHADGALVDLHAGSELVFGPVIDGDLYLLGLRHPLPEVLARLEEALASGGDARDGGPGAAAAALAAGAESGLEIGYLRPERGLRTPADVAVALADPLTPASIRRILADE